VILKLKIDEVRVKDDDENKEITNLIDTDNILSNYEKFIKEYNGCNCCCVVYNYCQTEHINIIKIIVDIYGMFNAIILYQDETGKDICDNFGFKNINNYDTTYRTLSTCIFEKVIIIS